MNPQSSLLPGFPARIESRRRRFLFAALAALVPLCMAGAASAQQTVDPQAAPNDFVQSVGNNALNAVRSDAAAKQGDLRRINELIDQYLLPYVNFEKTTRLAAGQS
ncbi:MAG: hypothetical protein ACTS5Y_09615, partial [Pollutimonas bauzanensis]